MSEDELEEFETRVSASKHPDNYVKTIIANLNEHEEAVVTAMGNAQQNLERILGKLQIQKNLEGSVYNLPDFEFVEVSEYSEVFEDDDGDREVDGKRVKIEVE